MTVVASKAEQGHYLTQLVADQARWLADADGAQGEGAAPDPHQLLDAALAACTAITVRMYAERKGMALQDVVVTIRHKEEGGVYQMERQLQFVGDLTEQERARLTEIAGKCPVHKTLSGRFEITTQAQ
ncbi:OsmC family protein [Chitinimonas sp. JJ19]|uniref:OsmC family protein n=1 Tax=Chitinimonas sp. JJ19 TaxID=3109352 RepID=UPI003002942E